MNNPNDSGPAYPPPPGANPPPHAGPVPAPPGPYGGPGGHNGRWGPPQQASGGRTALIVGIVFLALILVAGATLYFTGMFDRWFGKAPATASTTGTAPAPTAGTSTGGAPVAMPPPPRPMTVPPNGQYLVGTWGPNCPGSTANSATLHSDGTAIDPNGASGTWTIDDGSTVTVTINGVTRSAHWGMQASGRDAIVRPVGGGNPTRVSRC